jgi:HlyD family secretion protein
MKGVWVKRAALAGAAVAVAAGFAWALRERPTLVDVAEIAEAPMRMTIREEGVTRVRDIYTISAPIAGHLTRTVLDEGDRVEAGKTVVASIRPLDSPLIDRRTEAELLATRDAARSAVSIAEIELKRAETALRLVEDELARALRLYGPGIISESALQRITNDVEIQKAAVEAARATIGFRQAELASAEARLLQPEPSDPEGENCCVNLVAPVDGTVLGVLARSEQAVSAGARVAEIGNTADLEIVVDLLSADAVRIRPGIKALISDWGAEQPLLATVRRVDPAAFTNVSALGIEEQRVNAVLDLDQPEERLGHAYRVFAEMAVWECDRCLQVPIGALFRDGNKWNVFLVEGDRLRRAEIQIGNMNDEVAEVLGGVVADDIVVVHPGDTLVEGSLVERR